MSYPTRIVVHRAGVSVFDEAAGKYGQVESACRDFACFASPIIGAAYNYPSFRCAALQIGEKGYETTFHFGEEVRRITPADSRRNIELGYRYVPWEAPELAAA